MSECVADILRKRKPVMKAGVPHFRITPVLNSPLNNGTKYYGYFNPTITTLTCVYNKLMYTPLNIEAQELLLKHISEKVKAPARILL